MIILITVSILIGLIIGWYVGDFIGEYLVEWIETATANDRVAADKEYSHGSISNKELGH